VYTRAQLDYIYLRLRLGKVSTFSSP
jgi:hypothetical protein